MSTYRVTLKIAGEEHVLEVQADSKGHTRFLINRLNVVNIEFIENPERDCRACGGDGYLTEKSTCPYCNGTGKVVR